MQVQADAPIFLALVVQDLERSVEFYQDLLGMEEIKRVVVSDEKAVKGGFSAKGFRFRTFRKGPLALKLVEVEGEPTPTQGLVDTHTGVRYIAFAVDDIDAVHKTLQNAGVAFAVRRAAARTGPGRRPIGVLS